MLGDMLCVNVKGGPPIATQEERLPTLERGHIASDNADYPKHPGFVIPMVQARVFWVWAIISN
jgi:hypothetical protein